MPTTKVVPFDLATDIPSLVGKVILITGANSGLGKQSSLELAKHNPARIWMAARNPEKGNQAVADVKSQVPDAKVTFLEMDLSSFDSIKKAAKTIQMGTNHIGHALLLKLLTPLLEQTATPTATPSRIVSLASAAFKHIGPEMIQFSALKSLDGVSPVSRYIQSKTANLLYAQGFAKHNPRVTIVSVDPGEVATQLFLREPGDEQMTYLQTDVAPKMTRPIEEGVKNPLWAAVAVEGVPSGVMLDEELAGEVWEWTQKELEDQQL
ncbi:hypothetical protein B0H63DRAFT_494386 [Podospora didyma]|uniref:Oxidoreductase n=1 Tax=Podospora didyma TaxID=330526 RepID=A0AAE0NPH4_9PEZI|nr:hypothetical protein B0H63DRAFT_494386 [Podospora didyma]